MRMRAPECGRGRQLGPRQDRLIGSATATPIDLTPTSPARYPTRSMLRYEGLIECSVLAG